MPSIEHELLLELFKSQPQLLKSLLPNDAQLKLPENPTFTLLDSALAELDPLQFHPDALIAIQDASALKLGPEPAEPEALASVEVQLNIDPAKHIAWLAQLWIAYRIYRKVPLLIVITPSRRVARWAKKPFKFGPNVELRPIVIGPDEIPKNLSLEQVRANPALGVVSLLAHGEKLSQTSQALAKNTFLSLDEAALDPHLKTTCTDLIFQFLPEALMRELSSTLKNYKFKTPVIREAFESAIAEGHAKGHAKGLAEGLAEGRTEGLAEGLAEGKQEGLTEGRAKGLAEGELRGKLVGLTEGKRQLLIKQIERKFGALKPKQLARIQAANSEELDLLAERLFDVSTIQELFRRN